MKKIPLNRPFKYHSPSICPIDYLNFQARQQLEKLKREWEKIEIKRLCAARQKRLQEEASK
jgi:hypothetical protein